MTQACELQWLYIDFNSYFASVEQQVRPELRGRPVAVIPVDTPHTCAIAASYEAKAFGIKTGTPVVEARQRCPDLVCVLARHELYVEFHHKILGELENHLPITAVCSIDEMACRLMRNESTAPAVRRIAAAIKRGLAHNVGACVRCSIGVAPNRYLAKVAADMKKPDGLTLLGFNNLKERLFALELSDLPGIGHNMERRLIAAGVHSVADLWALDAARLTRLWGNIWGERMWHLLRGADLELPDLSETRRSLGHSHVLAPELRDPPEAIQVARRLTLKAASRLRRIDYYASSMSFAARLESGVRLHAEEQCWRAQDSLTFLRLLDAMWTRVTSRTGAARMKKISITFHKLIPAGEREADLFEAVAPADLRYRAKAEQISHALDRINSRFGRDTVNIGMLKAESRRFSGVRIAFTRIPDQRELW